MLSKAVWPSQTPGPPWPNTEMETGADSVKVPEAAWLITSEFLVNLQTFVKTQAGTC